MKMLKCNKHNPITLKKYLSEFYLLLLVEYLYMMYGVEFRS